MADWNTYDRPKRVTSFALEAEKAALRGWLEATQTMTPTQAWQLRKAMGLPNITDSEAYQMACIEWPHKQDGPSPHPLLFWKLDQDRRCHDAGLSAAHDPKQHFPDR